VAGDTNSNGDVFVKDLQTGTLTIASKSAAGTLGNGFSHSPHISADGRFVTFLSDATNLVSGLSTPINQQVYIKDLKTGAIKHLSPSTSGGKSNGDSFKPRISCDGGIVAFTSTASNLVSGDTNGRKDVFVYELGGESAELTDITLSANDDSADAVVSCDGNKIAYSTRATNISGTDANGGLSDVYVYDRTLQTHTLASTSTGGTQGNKTSQYPSISGDGRFVSFTSESTNFVSNDNHDFTDIYLRDVKYSTTELISINTGGSSTPPGTANTLGWAGQGDLSVISADATTVAFSGVGNFIVTGDNDGIKDIYAAATGRD